VPTLKDLGYGIVSNSPYGLAGPKGMDPKVVKVLHDAFKKGLEEPLHLKTLETLDMEPFYKNTEDYAKYARELYEFAKTEVDQAGLAKKS
jgi:tripartite-type tricarboxylate transporter receptor subunit TctC